MAALLNTAEGVTLPPQLPAHGTIEARIILMLAHRPCVTAAEIGLGEAQHRFVAAVCALERLGWVLSDDNFHRHDHCVALPKWIGPHADGFIDKNPALKFFEHPSFLEWQEVEVIHAMESSP